MTNLETTLNYIFTNTKYRKVRKLIKEIRNNNWIDKLEKFLAGDNDFLTWVELMGVNPVELVEDSLSQNYDKIMTAMNEDNE